MTARTDKAARELAAAAALQLAAAKPRLFGTYAYRRLARIRLSHCWTRRRRLALFGGAHAA